MPAVVASASGCTYVYDAFDAQSAQTLRPIWPIHEWATHTVHGNQGARSSRANEHAEVDTEKRGETDRRMMRRGPACTHRPWREPFVRKRSKGSKGSEDGGEQASGSALIGRTLWRLEHWCLVIVREKKGPHKARIDNRRLWSLECAARRVDVAGRHSVYVRSAAERVSQSTEGQGWARTAWALGLGSGRDS